MKSLVYIISFFTILMFSEIHAQDNIPGLIASFPFDGDVKDVSKNGIRTMAMDSITFVTGRDGKTNGAIHTNSYGTNGNSKVNQGGYIRIMDSIPFENLDASDFTVSCWIKYDMNFSDGGAFVFKDFSSLNGQLITFCTPYFQNRYSQPLDWYHFVWKSQNHVVSEYLNDSLCNSQPANNFLIRGLNGYFLAYFLAGALDDLNIYKRALSDAEISSLYHAPVVTATVTGQSQHALHVFPNPSSDKIQVDKEGTLMFYNILGEVVYTSETSSADISSLPRGSYNLSVKTKEGTMYYAKFLKN